MIVFAVAPLAAEIWDRAESEDQSYAGRFGHERRRQQSLAARGLVRILLAGHVDPARRWRIDADAQGRPSLGDGGQGIFMSLAHGGVRVAAAISLGRPIGIDIEERRPSRDWKSLSRAFGPLERAYVEQTGMLGFYRIWTLREALAKARGTGFASLIDETDQLLPAPADVATHSEDLETHTIGLAVVGTPQPEGDFAMSMAGPIRIWNRRGV
jgi:phosphopantetheinyl transferase